MVVSTPFIYDNIPTGTLSTLWTRSLSFSSNGYRCVDLSLTFSPTPRDVRFLSYEGSLPPGRTSSVRGGGEGR